MYVLRDIAVETDVDALPVLPRGRSFDRPKVGSDPSQFPAIGWIRGLTHADRRTTWAFEARHNLRGSTDAFSRDDG